MAEMLRNQDTCRSETCQNNVFRDMNNQVSCKQQCDHNQDKTHNWDVHLFRQQSESSPVFMAVFVVGEPVMYLWMCVCVRLLNNSSRGTPPSLLLTTLITPLFIFLSQSSCTLPLSLFFFLSPVKAIPCRCFGQLLMQPFYPHTHTHTHLLSTLQHPNTHPEQRGWEPNSKQKSLCC